MHLQVAQHQSYLSLVLLNKSFTADQLVNSHCREDCREFLSRAGIMVGFNIEIAFKKPKALHLAHWMAKAIESLKIEL